MVNVLEYLPRGNMLDDEAWSKRHRFLQWVLLLHPVGMFALAALLGRGLADSALVLSPVLACLLFGHVITRRRPASFFVTAGLVYCSAALVWITSGSIESHFHFFVIIGFIALYQDWVPFLWNIVFTVVSHGLGSWLQRDMMFNHPAAQNSPWLWSAVHGIAVLAACTGMVIFWRVSEDEQQEREALAKQLSDAEIGRRRFTSELLVNLARRNQTMLYRQLDIINQLEEKEQDPDALAELFRLDHLATRVQRNAESLLVLSGEEPYRVWSAPVPLHDVVRAAIAETEHLDRVELSVDEELAVVGHVVTDLTHLLAELTENAVRFSPPDAKVDIRTRRYLNANGAQLLTIEDCGVGMPPASMESANRLLAEPPEVDLSVSRQLGFHVVARLAGRHDIAVSLTPTPGSGITAAVLIPAALFADANAAAAAAATVAAGAATEPSRPTRPGAARNNATRHVGSGHLATAPRSVAVGASPRAAISAATPFSAAATTPAVRTTNVPFVGAPSAAPVNGRWPGWWEPPSPKHQLTAEPRPTATEPRPAVEPRPAAELRPVAAEPGLLAEPQLARRVPQTHLAPELRWQQPESDDGAHLPSRAPEALSRYQASRRAARSTSGGDLGHDSADSADGPDGTDHTTGEHLSWPADHR